MLFHWGRDSLDHLAALERGVDFASVLLFAPLILLLQVALLRKQRSRKLQAGLERRCTDRCNAPATVRHEAAVTTRQ